jgi:hypothetical protein
MEFKGNIHVVIPHNKMQFLKRKTSTLRKKTCAMLNEKNLPNYFWAKAIAIVVYIMN